LKIFEHISEFRRKGFSVVTVGTFDGLHIGHQEIIGQMKTFARENKGETILITFDPHPRLVLDPNHDVKFILTHKRKFELLEGLGIDHVIVIPFTKEFSQTPSEDFIREYLAEKLGTDMLIVGYDHHFGRNREGDYEQLRSLGEELKFAVAEIPAKYVDGIPVSSTKIRNALTEGNVKLANRMLGYEYSLTGTVVEGNRIGRSMGFPTANIEIEDKYKLIAAGGVYACRVEYDGKIYNGMGNIGTRPTIGKHDFTTEVHIFDFDGDIYGYEISIYFVDRVRDERKFGGLDELKGQLEKDREVVRKLLNC
jgi:riboflavin kinase/FMN adenylyltransferase